MWTLARKLLLHDRIKFAVAAAGVSISVQLVLVQIGLYQGFMQIASTLIDHSTADVWVTSEGSESFDFSAPIDDRAFYKVASTPGVAHAERMMLQFGQLKLDDGGVLGVQVIGTEADGHLLAPWNVVAGDARNLRDSDGITIDRSEHAKLRFRDLGHHTEISGTRARVVAVTEGIRSFTTSPLIFTNLDAARTFTGRGAEEANYVLVEAGPGIAPAELASRLDAIPHLDAYPTGEFSQRTQSYWSTRTGVGAGFFTTAVLGVIVGLVVVGQILYNSTLQHIREYGTLKAMGARNGAIVRLILYQALISAVVGFVIGSGMAVAARSAMTAANLVVALTPGLFITTAIVTVAMCSLASLLSIIKVLRLDPATVFKG